MPSLAEALGYGDPAAAVEAAPPERKMPGPGFIPGQLNLNAAIAPQVPQGAARPFAPGEWIDNPDRSWSSEESMTVPWGNGQWANIPSLWLKDGKPYVAHNEDEASELAKGSGLPFRTYPDEKSANDAATEREKQWQGIKPEEAGKVAPLWDAQKPASEEKGFLQQLLEHLNPIGSARGAELPAAPESFRKEVIGHESGGRPNIGWQNTDLTPYLEAGKVTETGFPDWPGKPSGTFDASGKELPSTAAGLYGITKTNYNKYGKLLGITDFSPESQTKVFNAMYADSGEAPWRPYWKGGGDGRGGGGAGGFSLAGLSGSTEKKKAFGLDDEDGLEEESDRRERDRLRAQFAKFAADRAPPEFELPTAPAAAPAPAEPAEAPQTAIQPPRPALPDIYIPKAPNLREAYQAAIASILQPKRNPLEAALRG